MSSVGVFLEKEINGEPFHIFSLLPQTADSSSSSPSLSGKEAINSGGDDNDLSLQTGFLCPKLRYFADISNRGYWDFNIVPVSTSPHFHKEAVDQLVLDNKRKFCKHPILPLFGNNENPNVVGPTLECGECKKPEVGSGYYLCQTCKTVFHKECVEAPLFIKHHPSFPSLSLRLHSAPSPHRSPCCIICETRVGKIVYYCPTYEVEIHVVCALKPIPIIITYLKRHPHPLTFFPKQTSLACNICGIIKEFTPTYVCARCVFVVHQDCIYFPYVIRICRHHHRISFTYSLPSGKLSCGVCRRKVDNSYGAYSCNKCDGYFVHPRCALRRNAWYEKDLWDGKELEGTPEEPEIVKDPFKTIAEGIILHFSHRHQLKLEISRVYDEDKYCQACCLPIYEGNYYSCVDEHCDFILHETCANAPCKIRHPLHAHSLTLKVVEGESIGFVHRSSAGSVAFMCSACRRLSNGFLYEGESIGFCPFRLDVRCALISEPFTYEGHKHPLFLALRPDEEWTVACQICRDKVNSRKLNCIECNFIICFACATLPYKAKYKHDKHFLTFRKELVATDQSDWCEACEKKIVYSGEGGFYACDEYCCTTLHVDCLLGDPYMKLDQTVYSDGDKSGILPNNTMSRPFCSYHRCKVRCPHRVVFKTKGLTFCSYVCARRHNRQ